MPTLTTLASLDDLKAYLGKTDALDDALLTRLLEAASEFVQRQTGRQFGVSTYTETKNGNGRNFIVPEQYPVTEVTSVTIGGVPVDAAASVTADGFVLQGNVIYLRGQWATQGFGNVTIVYTAGYSPVPSDIQQAVIELAALKFRERTRLGEASQAFSGMSVSFLPSIVPLSVQTVIDAYKRVAF